MDTLLYSYIGVIEQFCLTNEITIVHSPSLETNMLQIPFIKPLDESKNERKEAFSQRKVIKIYNTGMGEVDVQYGIDCCQRMNLDLKERNGC